MVFHLHDRHGGLVAEDAGQPALAVGGQVDDDHVRQPEVGGQRLEQVLQGFDTTGGCPDAHDRYRRWSFGLLIWQRRPPGARIGPPLLRQDPAAQHGSAPYASTTYSKNKRPLTSIDL